MSEAERLIQNIYDDGLESLIRITADTLRSDRTHDKHTVVHPAKTWRQTSHDAVKTQPGSFRNPVYIGKRNALTVTRNLESLNETYATITKGYDDGPHIQPRGHTTLTIDYKPQATTKPMTAETGDYALIDQAHLAEYVKPPHRVRDTTGHTAVTINPSNDNTTFYVTNNKAYHAHHIYRIGHTPLNHQTTDPSTVDDKNITRRPI